MLFRNEANKTLHPYYTELKSRSIDDNALECQFTSVASYKNTKGQGLLDTKFCSQFKSAPFQGLLELELADYLIALELDVFSDDSGPDFKIPFNVNQSVWIEAVCPTAGNDTPNQGIQKTAADTGNTQLISVPMRDESFERRITAVLAQKQKSYQRYVTENTVAPGDVKLIAISLDEINTCPLNDDFLKIRLKSILFEQSSVVIINNHGDSYQQQMSLSTKNDSLINCNFFQDNQLVQGVILKGHSDFYYFDRNNRDGISLRCFINNF